MVYGYGQNEELSLVFKIVTHVHYSLIKKLNKAYVIFSHACISFSVLTFQYNKFVIIFKSLVNISFKFLTAIIRNDIEIQK